MNSIVRNLVRCYPFKKGKYRLMTLAENFLIGDVATTNDFLKKYSLTLDISKPSIQRSFFYFQPEAYEPNTQRYIRENIAKGSVVADIGAHIGFFTIALADAVGKDGKVFSFEPENKNYNQLVTNISQNHLDWVFPRNEAASNETGETIIQVCPFDDGGHSLVDDFNEKVSPESVSKQSIQTTKLDEFAEKEGIRRFDLVKIDAEKSELRVLAGAEGLIQSGGLPRILCEIHSSSNTTEAGYDRVRKCLYDKGYRSFYLERNYLEELSPDEDVVGLQNILFEK